MGQLEQEKFDPSTRAACWRVGEWRVEIATNQIIKESELVQLEPKAMLVLVYLLTHKHKPVSAQELLKSLWPGIAVSENSVRRIIAQLRRALNDDASNPKYIATYPRAGYQLVAKTTALDTESTLPNPYSLQYWLPQRWHLLTSLTISLSSIVVLSLLFASRDKASHWLENNKIETVTSLPGRELAPTFSADGKAIIFAYAKERSNSYTLQLQWLDENTSHQISGIEGSPFAPAWSPDGVHLAYTNLKPCQIMLAKLSDDWRTVKSQQVISECKNRFFAQLAWSPTGDALYFNQHKKNAESTFQQFRYDLSTQKYEQIDFAEIEPQKGFYKLLPHPNKNVWALMAMNGHQNSNIWLYNPVTKSAKLIAKLDEFSPNFDWCGASDAVELVAGIHGKLVAFAEDGTERELSTVHEPGFSYIDCSPVDKKMMFASRQRNSSLVVESNPLLAHSDGLNTQEVYTSSRSEQYPRWSNLGKKLAFVSNRSGEWKLWVGQSGEPRPIGDVSFATQPYLMGWSKLDSDLLLLVQNRIVCVNARTGKLEWLTSNSESIEYAAWSFDNDVAYFKSSQSNQIESINIRTKLRNKVTSSTGLDMAAGFYGRYIYFTKKTEDGLWQHEIKSGIESLRIADFPENTIFQPFAKGIYFHQHKGEKIGFYFYDFKENKITTLLEDPNDLGHDFSISADQKSIAFTALDSYRSDLKIIQAK